MRQVNGQTAKEISEMILAVTADALLSGNFSQFKHWFHLPHTIETADTKKVLHTKQDLRAVFDDVVSDYQRKRVTQLVRICEAAEFASETRLVATHVTHMMSGNHRIADPFPSFTVLELIDDRWQATATQYAVDTQTTVGRALSRMTDPGADLSEAAHIEEDKK